MELARENPIDAAVRAYRNVIAEGSPDTRHNHTLSVKECGGNPEAFAERLRALRTETFGSDGIRVFTISSGPNGVNIEITTAALNRISIASKRK